MAKGAPLTPLPQSQSSTPSAEWCSELGLNPQQLHHEAVAQLARLACDPARGLSPEEVARRQRVHGRNLYDRRRFDLLQQGGWQFLVPVGFGLGAAIAWGVAGATVHAVAALVVVGLLVVFTLGLAAVVREQQQRQAAPPWYVAVLRAGRLERVAVETLVPGDIVWLRAGARFPAELKVLIASSDWQTKGSPPQEWVVSGSAWAVVVRLRPREASKPGQLQQLSAWSALAVAAAGAAVAALTVVAGYPVSWAVGQGAFVAALLWPLGAELARHRRLLAALAALARAGVWCRSEQVFAALAQQTSPWCCAWPAWLPRWQVTAIALPFDTVTVDPIPSELHEEAGEQPLFRLWRSGRQVVNPLAVTGMIPLAQATRLLVTPGPHRQSLMPLPAEPLALPLWQLTEMLVGQEHLDPCLAWRVVRRQRSPTLGEMGWLVFCSDNRGRYWVIVSGEPEALWAAGVDQCTSGRRLDRSQWQVRLAQLRQAGGWTVAVAMHRWPNAGAVPQNPLPELRWAGVWSLMPQGAALTQEVAEQRPMAIAAHPFPADVVAAWQEQQWWPKSPPCVLPAHLPATAAPWVVIAPQITVLLTSNQRDETPWADGALPQGDLAALVAGAALARNWYERLVRIEQGERWWRWGGVTLLSVAGLFGDGAIWLAATFFVLILGWFWPLSRGTIHHQ